MARNRIIKPEFWGDRKISLLSLPARLLFIGMWNFADDYGVIKYNINWLIANIFENDAIEPKMMQGWVDELISQNVLVPFEAESLKYLYIRNWKRHQKVDKPSPRRNPEPPRELMPNDSGNNSPNDSPNRSVTNKNKKENKKEEIERDIYHDPEFLKILETYKGIMGSPAVLNAEERKRLLSIIGELNKQGCNPAEATEKVFERLKTIKWEFKDGKKRPKINWLLKDSNFFKVLNGEFGEVKENEVNKKGRIKSDVPRTIV
jgi:hypothetical protein